MQLHAIDWMVIAVYVMFALGVGLYFARRASRNIDEYFLSGRSLPWWVAGTSMVATTFASDTPLVVSGWVRDHGIWKNWLWWCFAISGMFGVFLFARWWRRGGVMTKAELAELRYGGPEARVLRGVLGGIQAGVTNTIVLCWVLLAAGKIIEVLLGVDKFYGVLAGCIIALTYSLLAGFWGVVLTDLVQFVMAVVGAITLAVAAWGAIGGTEGLAEASRNGVFTADTLRFFPAAGEGGPFSLSFWTVSFTAIAVYLGVLWWGSEGVDGSGTSVQRICASRNEREGMLAVLWYNVAHYAIRPWPWIMVGVASLVILPTIEVEAPQDGTVVAVSDRTVVIRPASGGADIPVAFVTDDTEEDWRPDAKVTVDADVEAGDVIARTDSESAYVVMMARYLGVGLLGLVAASLLAAFMSTIDTHINLASSFFVNDIYRRFLKPGQSDGHYVGVARVASVVVLSMGGVLAYLNDHIGNLFQFFLAFLGGVGPVYILRWLWWRVRATTEITAMVTSVLTTVVLTRMGSDWSLGPLSPEGVLSPEGRQILVVLISNLAALTTILFGRSPEPHTLVAFYRKVRPIGWWGPVRELAPEVEPDGSFKIAILGALGGLGLIFGVLFGTGFFLLGEASSMLIAAAVALVGGFVTAACLRRL